MLGYRFTDFVPDNSGKSTFDKLLELFLEILNRTSGDVAETLHWMNLLDQKYNLTDDEYGMGDFIQELKDKGYIKEDGPGGELHAGARDGVGGRAAHRGHGPGVQEGTG